MTLFRKIRTSVVVVMLCWIYPVPAETYQTAELSSDEIYQRIPHRWVELYEDNKRLVIQEYCDAGLTSLRFYREGGRIMLVYNMGQEAALYSVVSGQAQGSKIDIQLTNEYESPNFRVVFTEPDEKLATWSLLGRDAVFVQGLEDGGVTDNVLNIPVQAPLDDCEAYH